jgi:hypothetical protein
MRLEITELKQVVWTKNIVVEANIPAQARVDVKKDVKLGVCNDAFHFVFYDEYRDKDDESAYGNTCFLDPKKLDKHVKVVVKSCQVITVDGKQFGTSRNDARIHIKGFTITQSPESSGSSKKSSGSSDSPQLGGSSASMKHTPGSLCLSGAKVVPASGGCIPALKNAKEIGVSCELEFRIQVHGEPQPVVVATPQTFSFRIRAGEPRTMLLFQPEDLPQEMKNRTHLPKVYVDVCMYMCVYVCVCIYIYIYTCVYIYTYTYICICIYTYKHSLTHTHTHTHIYIYMRAPVISVLGVFGNQNCMHLSKVGCPVCKHLCVCVCVYVCAHRRPC